MLQRLYSKTRTSRDHKTRQENLVRRFLGGLKDGEARFEIESHKEPEDIDEADYHAVNVQQTRRRSTSEFNKERKFKKYVHRTSEESDYKDSEEDHLKDRADTECTMRVPSRGETISKMKPKSNRDLK